MGWQLIVKDNNYKEEVEKTELINSSSEYQNFNDESSNEVINYDYFQNLSYSEIKKRDIAYQVYSKYLDDTFWICSNEKMIEQIKIDDPESVVYHIDEIVRINKLKPDIKGLKSIHQVKKKFRNSKVIATIKKKY